jgi:hypothetical protein
MIDHVAIYYKGEMYSLPRPNRHHDAIRVIAEKTGDSDIFGIQGFLAEGRFLKRTEAKEYAVQCGQVKETPHGHLFSEDLW